MATSAQTHPVTATEFLQIDFGPNLKAELDRGVIRMMAGGTYAHSVVQMNLYRWLGAKLRGTGCRPHGSDMAVEVRDWSVRYPDVTIDCSASNDHVREKVLSDPRIVIEVLSPSTREYDLTVKLNEYRAIGGVHSVAFVDPDNESIAVTHRTPGGGWTDLVFGDDTDLHFPALNLTIPCAEIFARD